ncbi:MAG: hypothetical protein P8M67_06905 [Opitutales bacterium]|nr:hypothetical protein [Opitutales bacterium]
MDSTASENINQISENQFREKALSGNDRSSLEVPEMGKQSSVKVTKSGEELALGGSLQDRPDTTNPENCAKPGEPIPSVDNLDDTGIDCTRDPDWKVIESDKLDENPQPNEVHNDKYWDERSLDTQLQKQDLQEKLIREEMENFDRAAHVADDDGRPFQNEVLDPYHAGGRPPSEPPSGTNSLDSFV